MNSTHPWILACAMALFVPASTSAAPDAVPATPDATLATPSEPLTDGAVLKIDLDQGKVTIKHGAIANLDMPPMTMVFRAASPGLLAGLKPGDKIRFRAESSAGAISVTRIEAAEPVKTP